jgi:hypothetical protein
MDKYIPYTRYIGLKSTICPAWIFTSFLSSGERKPDRNYEEEGNW